MTPKGKDHAITGAHESRRNGSRRRSERAASRIPSSHIGARITVKAFVSTDSANRLPERMSHVGRRRSCHIACAQKERRARAIEGKPIIIETLS